MGEASLGYIIRRDFNAQSTGRTDAAPGAAAAAAGVAVPSQSLLIGPAAPGAAGVAGNATGIYSLQGVYFNKQNFSSVADCLTAASAKGLPLDVCR